MSEVITRPAIRTDATGMCSVLNAIIARGGTTAYETSFDQDRMIRHYIEHPKRAVCTVALLDDGLVGFQSVKHFHPDWPDDETPPKNWGDIASFVADGMQGKGIGSHLFSATLDAAKQAGLVGINATIRKYNTPGLAYYSGLGFVDYREDDITYSKKYVISPEI